ncbi:DMT family transporter [Ramlibacter rhizophilus]|uniref:DMT family transporter n=1 Tax=Ramlibacter rhizophilus TaxID=1781167 RepID=A0A4Z0BEU4_9BURK|nr:DMT family transporter [Ramlibacter rhizophilus]TFY97340.1 DMT family transporter [Ramlibacter rhizophilus]
MLWATLGGFLFVCLNATMRGLARQLDPFQAQFIRYLMGLVVLAPMLLRSGLASWKPASVRGQFGRGVVHTSALTLWFLAAPHVTLADMTAIGFMTPIFIMLGAALFLDEKMQAARWVAAMLGLVGVLIVVGPQLSGQGGVWLLVLLGSSPLFAASFIIVKAQTRRESSTVIVAWQSITVALLSLPLALLEWRSPTLGQWLLGLLGGIFGSAGHYAMTRAFSATDISATQSVKFLEMVWAALLGFVIFQAVPSGWTLIGGTVICASTVWIARREALRSARRGL